MSTEETMNPSSGILKKMSCCESARNQDVIGIFESEEAFPK